MKATPNSNSTRIAVLARAFGFGPASKVARVGKVQNIPYTLLLVTRETSS